MLDYDDLHFEYFSFTKVHLIIFISLYILGIFLSFSSKLDEHQDKKAVLEAVAWPVILFIVWPVKSFLKIATAIFNNSIKMYSIIFKNKKY